MRDTGGQGKAGMEAEGKGRKGHAREQDRWRPEGKAGMGREGLSGWAGLLQAPVVVL